MADTKQAFDYVLKLEDDAKHPGCITLLKGDKGGRTRLGIAENFHHQLSAQGFYDGAPIEGSNPQRWQPTTISLDKGLTIAQSVYATEYAIPLSIDQIADQALANSLLALSVHTGPRQAAVLLQRALPIAPQDGIIGPKTLKAIAGTNADALRGRFLIERQAFYKHLIETQPELSQYANGMLNRAAA